MPNFQGICFIWTQAYREILKSALVYLWNLLSNLPIFWYSLTCSVSLKTHYSLWLDMRQNIVGFGGCYMAGNNLLWVSMIRNLFHKFYNVREILFRIQIFYFIKKVHEIIVNCWQCSEGDSTSISSFWRRYR